MYVNTGTKKLEKFKFVLILKIVQKILYIKVLTCFNRLTENQKSDAN